MKKSLIIAWFVWSLGARAYAGAGLKLPYVAPVQGQVSTVTSEESLKGTLTVDGKSTPMEQSLTETYTEELVTVSRDAVTKEKITVTAAHRTLDAMGQKQDADLPIKGRTYVVTGDGRKTTVTNVDDVAPLGRVEESIVSTMAAHIGLPDKVGKLIAERTFEKGKKVRLTADEADAMMGKRDGMRASGVAMTLTGQDGKTATFAMNGTFHGKPYGVDVTIVFKGTVKIDVEASRPLDFKMTGTIKSAGEMDGKMASMTGAMAAHKTITYK